MSWLHSLQSAQTVYVKKEQSLSSLSFAPFIIPPLTIGPFIISQSYKIVDAGIVKTVNLFF
ncbi:hypothetical protein Desor_4292 [Desulfosporosinus orientis DSM 765]|uniref:Uncharacterized protein n=1 Tax=Desulfosporosinus orientis (strain ATCC 19365 / DSM 765 / NCIMB 8382 / VKM B-1628 / Singapore I) TaxID=768706 RepID=G7WIZ8_DESOD|nr:hypothetical protein Desor_4292 [Desulfosporosinus orientis DSM 765]